MRAILVTVSSDCFVSSFAV